ncbi:MAG: FAD-dependent oxidoreductase [Saprospiraceae bacterium]|nr:FAD-dependent oxidoreductase [Saprospiraceae bacterium]
MTRKDFIKVCGILGVGIPLQSSFSGCSSSDDVEFDGKVLIIGAGAGGLSAGYLLQQMGIDYQIIEASDQYGGRMQITNTFADFPIPLGAEWLHAGTNEFNKIVNDSSVQVNVETKAYEMSDTYAIWNNGELDVSSLEDDDIKFVDSTWYNFYEDYIVPSVLDKIVFNSPVQSIDYSAELIKVVTNGGNTFEADKIIISVPVKLLQLGTIDFQPALPSEKLTAIDDVEIWDGFKAFFEFSENFYPTQTQIPIEPETDGQKLFYDAAYGQNSDKHILGVFTVGKPALDYINKTESELKELILAELDVIFDNQASQHYMNHITKDWLNEPYIGGGYVSDYENWQTVKKLSESVDNKIFFAGGAYTSGEDWVSVHTAAQSAKEAVGLIVK